ncbi:hypothetical protein Nepgr_025668 [Nepenthes gracilis]|uniref:Pentatricopeptide repeat-containing protein n=1 Tax=Nepenthes gracilis TaxID=150966 RepID=A0AAD3T5I2_NEPGR|nr:hypothetical protein Nepgr_025668 [Nepenthes gracilis]
MTSSYGLRLELSKLHLHKSIAVSHSLNHSLVTTSAAIHDPQLNSQSESEINRTPSDHPKYAVYKAIANKLEKCPSIRQLNQLHALLIRTHFLVESYHVSFYYNSIIRSYTRTNAPRQAVQVYLSMSRAGVPPDSFTLPITLKAICQFYSIQTGLQLHTVMIHHGLEGDEYCESGLISMYCKVGDFGSAYKLFDGNSKRKLGSWNAIIGSLSQSRRAKAAVLMFVRMKRSGFRPDDVTMVSIMTACGNLGDLNLGLQLHKCVFQARNSMKDDVLMLNSLIDMYGKCGRMDLAHGVFSGMDLKNVSSWTSMIVGYASNGYVRDAVECFRGMREACVMPNHVTFVGVLSACVHGGMVEEGKHYFQMMKCVYGIEPRIQHFGCMVDLLGRMGLLEEAIIMVEGMPMKANVVIWGCLMGACERYSDVKMGERVAAHLIELEPWNEGVYVVLSNIYANRNMWTEVGNIREVMKQGRLAKIPGYSLATIPD